MLQSRRAIIEARRYNNPLLSWVTISKRVHCSDEVSSNLMVVSTLTFGIFVVEASGVRRGDARELGPRRTSVRLRRNRSISPGFSSKVREESVKLKESRTIPAVFAKASALTMFIPQ